VLVAVAVLAGCSGGDPAPATDPLDGSVGLGERLDSAGGAHAVAAITDALDPTAVGEPVQVAPDEQLVAAVVTECASAGRAVTVSEEGWSVVLGDGSSVPSRLPPTAATEGSPSIDQTRRVPAGECRYARLLFVVPDDATVAAVHVEARGDAPAATWRDTASASVGD